MFMSFCSSNFFADEFRPSFLAEEILLSLPFDESCSILRILHILQIWLHCLCGWNNPWDLRLFVYLSFLDYVRDDRLGATVVCDKQPVLHTVLFGSSGVLLLCTRFFFVVFFATLEFRLLFRDFFTLSNAEFMFFGTRVTMFWWCFCGCVSVVGSERLYEILSAFGSRFWCLD
jgi:hypothetical protein